MKLSLYTVYSYNEDKAKARVLWKLHYVITAVQLNNDAYYNTG